MNAVPVTAAGKAMLEFWLSGRTHPPSTQRLRDFTDLDAAAALRADASTACALLLVVPSPGARTVGEPVDLPALYAAYQDAFERRDVDAMDAAVGAWLDQATPRIAALTARLAAMRAALEAVEVHFLAGRTPREADGCWPQDCSCGYVAVMDAARRALAGGE